MPWTNLEKPAPPPPLITEVPDDAPSNAGASSSVDPGVEIPEEVADCNETVGDAISFVTELNGDFLAPGQRTMPEVSEQKFGGDDPDRQLGSSECYDCELEAVLRDIPFLDYDIYRGKARGLGVLDKLFTNQIAGQRPVVGSFKVRFVLLILDVDLTSRCCLF